MTPDQDERLVSAFERGATALGEIAEAVEFLAMTSDARLALEYPAKPKPPDMTVTKTKDPDEDLKDELYGEDRHDPIEKWTSIGPREQAFQASARHDADGGGDAARPDDGATGPGAEADGDH